MDKNRLRSIQLTRQSALMFTLLVAVAILLFYLSALRQIGNYGVETDFYGGYVPNAQRLLAGMPLKIDFHPPFYPAILAAVYMIVGDWFRAGLLISVFSSVLVLLTVWRVFNVVFSTGAAVAATAALLVWPEFLQYSVSASSDMLFLSLMMLSLATAVGGERLTVRRAFVAGFIAALASLTRPNGITLLSIALICASRMAASQRARPFLICLAGFAVPWILWMIIAIVSGSPVLPTRTYVDIAAAFFNPEGSQFSSNSDNWQLAESKFSSLVDVILYDPRTLILGWAQNLLRNWWKLFSTLSVQLLPLAGICSLGIAHLVLRKRNALRLTFWLVYIFQYAVLGLRSFDSRYFLFLVPMVGHGAQAAGSVLFNDVRISAKTRAAIIIIAVAAGTILIGAVQRRNFIALLSQDATEVIAASSVLRQVSKPGDRIIARKPHLAFETGLSGVGFPLVGTTNDLYREVCPIPSNTNTFLFFGRAEAQRRPALRFLRTRENAPEWLIPIGNGKPLGGSWELYRVQCPDSPDRLRGRSP